MCLTRTTLFSVFSHFLVVQFSMIKYLLSQAFLLYYIAKKKSIAFFDFFRFFIIFSFLLTFNISAVAFLCIFDNKIRDLFHIPQNPKPFIVDIPPLTPFLVKKIIPVGTQRDQLFLYNIFYIFYKNYCKKNIYVI